MAPCIIFLDDVEFIGKRRGLDADAESSSAGVTERVLSTLLNEMDGIEDRKGVFVIACTTRPDLVDEALLRPGRLDVLMFVDSPGVEDRESIIQSLVDESVVQDGLDVPKIAAETEHWTGSDLRTLFRCVEFLWKRRQQLICGVWVLGMPHWIHWTKTWTPVK